MRRRIFNILAAVSLVVCLATVGLWIRSYWRSDRIGWYSALDAKWRVTRVALISASGVVVFWHRDEQFSSKPRLAGLTGWRNNSVPSAGHANVIAGLRGGALFSVLDFGLARQHVSRTSFRYDDWFIFAPHWFLVLLFVALPAEWLFVKRRKIRNRPRHLCKNCGYDLRATPEAGGPLLERCPECGSVPEGPSETAA